jgi:hypothetical protein
MKLGLPALRYAVTIAIASLAVLAACGEEEQPDPGEFLSEAERICLDTARGVAKVRAVADIPRSPAEAATLLDREIPVRTEGLTRLQALEPPDQLAPAWTSYLSLDEERVAAQQEGLDAAEQDDPDAFADYQVRFERLSDRLAETGTQIGLEACAELLPPAGQRDVAEVVERLLTSFDSGRVCEEAVTERFIEAFYGNVQDCIDTRPAPDAVSLKLLDSGGVASTYAFVDVEVTDFLGEKRQLRVELTFDDNTWRVDYRQPLSEESGDSS